MEKMDKGLTALKRELIVWLKIPKMPPKCSAQFGCVSLKNWDFQKKALSDGPQSVTQSMQYLRSCTTI